MNAICAKTQVPTMPFLFRSVEHMRHIDRAQEIFDAYGIVPNYVIDYPIASQDIAIRPLKAFADSGRALIGAGMKTHPGIAAKMFETLANEGVNIEMISTSTIASVGTAVGTLVPPAEALSSP